MHVGRSVVVFMSWLCQLACPKYAAFDTSFIPPKPNLDWHSVRRMRILSSIRDPEGVLVLLAKHVSHELDSASDAVSRYRIICANVYITRPSALFSPSSDHPRAAHCIAPTLFYRDFLRTTSEVFIGGRWCGCDWMGIASLLNCDVMGLAAAATAVAATVAVEQFTQYAQSSKLLLQIRAN